jgi:putative tryptophan/tyrosine transport system substrate-binding protein
MSWLEPIGSSDDRAIENPKSQIQNTSDSAQRAGAGGQSDQVKPFWIFDFRFLTGTSQNNKVLVLALSTLLLALSGSADGQQPVHLPRVGVLLALPQAAIADRIQAYQEGLRERGYFEGKTILMEYRSADGKFDRLSDLARELVRLKVNIIVTGGPTATRPAKEATTEIPIVMAQDTDPVGNGFVASRARPAGNITGLSNYHPDLSGKQLELLKEIIPRLARVAIVGNSDEPGNAQALKETELAARALGLQPYYLDARNAKAIETVLRSASKEGADAVLVLSTPSPLLIGKNSQGSRRRVEFRQCTR